MLVLYCFNIWHTTPFSSRLFMWGCTGSKAIHSRGAFHSFANPGFHHPAGLLWSNKLQCHGDYKGSRVGWNNRAPLRGYFCKKTTNTDNSHVSQCKDLQYTVRLSLLTTSLMFHKKKIYILCLNSFRNVLSLT